MSYSYFNADLTCLNCGKTEQDSVITSIEAESGAGHWVGTQLNVSIVDMRMSHDIVSIPHDNEPWRILEKWSCPNCRTRQWVEVILDRGLIRSIGVVPFDAATLDRIHFISELVEEFYKDTTGESIYVDHRV